MLRSFFGILSRSAGARQIVMRWAVTRRVAARFVAGETLSQALDAIGALNAKGIQATLDHLGENTSSPAEARAAARELLAALDAIHDRGLRANLSIKLTQIGLRVDPKICAGHLSEIVTYASAQENFIRVDMEDSPVTQITLDLVDQLRQQGLTNLGIVIQSYLYRSEADVKDLAAEGVPIRLCKGAYKEPAAVAFPKKSDVDAHYDRLATYLLEGSRRHSFPRLSANGRFPPLPAFASHDPRRIEHAKKVAAAIGAPHDALEFQMLYGIRRDLQQSLAAEGYPVRVYVPYGTQWYPYFMRRLGERPANVWFIVNNWFRK
jgi:proline dehydrogenase